jgi:hypothetical protein
MSDVIASCSTCLHKPATGGLDEVTELCWDCTSFKTLAHWEPRVTERRITVTPRPKELQEAMDKPSEPPKLTLEEYFETVKGCPDKPKLTLEEYVKTLSDNPMDTQVDGDHYKKLKIQPMEYSMANNLDACQHTVVKYVTRFRDKGGEKDIDKAIHALQMLRKFEYGN